MQAEYEDSLHQANKSRSRSKKNKNLENMNIATNDSTYQVSPRTYNTLTNNTNNRSISSTKKRNVSKQFNSISAHKNKFNEYTQLPMLKNMIRNPSNESHEMDITFADDDEV